MIVTRATALAMGVQVMLVAGMGHLALASFDDETVWDEPFAKAQALNQQGHDAQALPIAERALRIAKRLFGVHAIRTAESLELVGHIHNARGKGWRALYFYQRALAIWEQARGLSRLRVADVLILIAQVHVSAGKPDEAVPLLARALTIREALLGPAHPAVAENRQLLALLNERVASTQSLISLEQRRASTDQYVEERDQSVSQEPSLSNGRQGNAASRVSLERDTHIVETIQHPRQRGSVVSDHDAVPPRGPAAVSTAHETAQVHSLKLFAESLTERAIAYIRVGNYHQADELLREALEIYDRLYGPRHPNTLVLLGPVAKALQQVGRMEDAQALEARLRRVGSTSPRENP